MKTCIEKAAEILEDMADVADSRGIAYLYRKDTAQMREVIKELRDITNIEVKVVSDHTICGWYEAIQTGEKERCESNTVSGWCRGCPYNTEKIDTFSTYHKGFVDTLSPGGATARCSKRAW